MPDYRRNCVPGGVYFFTVYLLERQQDVLVRWIDVLRDAVRMVRAARPFHIDAWVVLPEHMHAIRTLPLGDSDYSSRWGAIKIIFAKAIPGTEYRSAVRLARGERGIRQRRFWEHAIRDELGYEAHVDDVHINPVKHGLVACVKDGPYSSFHAYVAKGIYASDWAGQGGGDVPAGERN